MARFVPRERKHRRLAKQAQSNNAHPAVDLNTNTQEILPEDRREKENKRLALLQGLREQQTSTKVSSKKRKRLDKYVDTKLRRDENVELLKKLAAQKVDTSLLRSSKKLGRVHENKREKLQRALTEREAGVDVDGLGDEVLFEAGREVEHGWSEENTDGDEDARRNDEEARVVPVVPQRNGTASTFGSGLKRPLETDGGGQPVIKKRKRRKEVEINTPEVSDGEDVSDEELSGGGEEEWNGFEEDEISDRSESPEDPLSESRSSSPSSVSETSSSQDQKPERVSAFKAWADSQRNAAIGFTPSAAYNNDPTAKANFVLRATSPDDMIDSIPAVASRPAAAITISRTEEVQAARLELPVVQDEQKIIEAIHNNPVVIVCGETGSGKTTQVPQMLFENGYGSQIGVRNQPNASLQSKGMIGITQPRRVAATSVAERVAHELGPAYRNRVAHQVRHDSNLSSATSIKFMTDGILLREIQDDFILAKYSCIVIDEAHERSVNTDLLIGMLSRIVPLRAELAKEEPAKHTPLKLVIMSATLRVSDFLANERLFQNGPPPIVEAEGMQFTVTLHFARKTRRDYVEEVVGMVARGHGRLPPGGMLVFLTGREEIETVARRLKGRLGSSRTDFDEFSPEANAPEDSESDTERQLDDDDAEFVVEEDQAGARGVTKPHILPLYAALPSVQQLRVFQPPPDGTRLIVLATNVAETSLTIPGIRYVFDCGRSKEKKYDAGTGVQTMEVDWISKASAAQRTGRAGRTGPGHCYRLYSSTVYERDFAEHSVPEILRTSLEATVLQLKAMEIENVVNFPFPTAPDPTQLRLAEQLLGNLGAVDVRRGTITDLGREMVRYPVSPRFGKMLWLAKRFGVVELVVAVVAALAVGDLYLPESVQGGAGDGDGANESSDDGARRNARAESAAKTAAEKRHQAYTRAHAKLAQYDDDSDAIKLLTTVAAHAKECRERDGGSRFCSDFFLTEKGMAEVQQLRQQLHAIVASSRQDNAEFKPLLKLPSDDSKDWTIVKQVVAAGFVDQVAIRADLLKDKSVSFGRKPRRAIEVPYRTLFPSSADVVDRNASPVEQEIQRSVFMHPSSVLAHLSVKQMPEYIVYSHLSRAPAPVVDGEMLQKTRMHPLTAIGSKALAAVAEGTPLLGIGKPIGNVENLPETRRLCWVGLCLNVPEAGSAWPLGACKVIQRREKGEWEVEKVVAR